MPKIALAVALSTLAFATMLPAIASAAPVPCENALATLKTVTTGAKLNGADKAKVADLTTKGLERCKADDDQGADDYFAEAMKLLGK